MALTDRYAFGPMLVNTDELVFGPNLVPEIGGEVPSINGVSTLRPEGIVTITLDEPVSLPLVGVSRGGRAFTSLELTAPNVIQGVAPKSGQINASEDLTVEDANGTSVGFPVTLEVPVGYSVVALSGQAFATNSLLVNSGWPVTAGNQFLLQTYTCDSDAVLTDDELLPGDYNAGVWYNDITNNYQASSTDTLKITVADWTVNTMAFTPNTGAVAGSVVQSVSPIEGIDTNVTMVLTNGTGEISNDGAATWSTSPLPSVLGQNWARATVSASTTPGNVEQQTVEVNRTSATFTVTTAGASLVAPNLGDYVTPAEITKGVYYEFEATIIEIGNPAGQFTDTDNNLPDGFTVDTDTGLVSGIATTTGAVTGDTRLENSEGFSDGAFNVTVVDPAPILYELRLEGIKSPDTGINVVSQMVNVRAARVSDGGEVFNGTATITNGTLVIPGISSGDIPHRVSFNSATFGETWGLDVPLVTSQVQA